MFRLKQNSPSNGLRCVQARHPNHVWLMDVTEIPSLFRIVSFKLVVVLDVFARMPLAGRVFLFEPTAMATSDLFRKAVARHGAPRHFVSDQGSQFTAESIGDVLKEHGVGQRFGAVGQTGSIAVIERLWKSLKEGLALKSDPPLTLGDLEERLRVGVLHYAYLRPHQALLGAVPAEVYFRIRPAHERAVSPPRGRPGQCYPVTAWLHYFKRAQVVGFSRAPGLHDGAAPAEMAGSVDP